MKYQVTQIVVVEAANPRHAAHIVQGMQKSDNISLDRYTVEPLAPSAQFAVDLSKERGQYGYQIPDKQY